MPDDNEREPANPPAHSSAVPRDKPVIEGRAEEIAPQETPVGSTADQTGADLPADDPWAALPGPAGAEAMPHSEAAESGPPPDGDGQVSRSPLAPLAAAIVVGAVLAIGGAFGLHLLDGTSAELALLKNRVGALERRPNPAQNLAAAQRNLTSRVVALEAATAESKEKIAAMTAAIDKPAAPKPAAAPDLAPLAARIGALEQKLSAYEGKIGDLATTVDAQKSQVRSAENRGNQLAAASANDEANAILAASLVRKVESGMAYEADLQGLAQRGFDRAKLAPLQSTAARGVATPAALAKQFAAVSPAILASAPQPKETGFLDHLVRGAAGLVRVEKIGDTSGSDLAARVTRIQEALEAGDVKTAYQEWGVLPAGAKAKSSSFATAAKARIDAIGAARGVEAEATAALGKGKS